MRTRHGRVFTGFGPAISKDALNKISAEVRSWRLHQHSDWTFGQLARRINPIVRGWMQYYGAFYRSALYRVCVLTGCRRSGAFSRPVLIPRRPLRRPGRDPALGYLP